MPLYPDYPQERYRASYLPISTSLPLPIFGCRIRLPCGPFAVFLDYDHHWEAIQMPLMHGLLVSVMERGRGSRHCSKSRSGYRGQGSDKCSSVLREGVTVELQGLSAEHSRYPNRPPDFSSTLPLPKPRVPANLPHLPCGTEDLISSLASAPGKKELEVH